jgi:tRNA-dependent cyclodipeptide synthase
MQGDPMEADTCTTPNEYATSGNVFVPISLGNHYYSSTVLRKLIDNFIVPSNRSVIFCCDRLRLLSYLIRGEMDLERITLNIKSQVEQLTRALVNVGIRSCPHATIVDWSFCQEDRRFHELLFNLKQFIRDDAMVARELNDHLNRLVHIHSRKGANTAKGDELQFNYLTEETALSLYMTEIRGYNVEVYRRGMGFVDYLYSQRPAELLTLTGNSVLTRRFIALENCNQPSNSAIYYSGSRSC